MRIIENPAKDEWSELVNRPLLDNFAKLESVKKTLDAVRLLGDDALRKLTKAFDGVEIDEIQVNTNFTELSPELSEALITAKRNIETFHKAQFEDPRTIETTQGVKCWCKSVPIETVGLYIPGGTAPLFSTVLMLATPAILAGCKNIVLCSPPNENGAINELISHTAKLCGIDKAFRVGGAQAIAAMAFGTPTIPKCDKIFGPGNSYVTLAKQLVSSEGVAIDMPAGPSEVAVIADAQANPTFVASDLLAQAEHGIDSQVVLVSDSLEFISATIAETERQIDQLPRKDIAGAALSNSLAVYFKSLGTGMDFLNQYAAEHLIISTQNPGEFAEKVENAGSVFVGEYACESAGDYASGTNHTLPTNGSARAYSGVSLNSFLKQITFQEISEDGIRNLGPAIIELAEAEELKAHSRAVAVRLAELGDGNEFRP